MKKLFTFLTLSILLQAQIAIAATVTECNRNFGLDVAGCAQVTAGSKKACVDDAKVAKISCLSGENSCLNTCTNTYNAAVTTCQVNNDPSFCGGIIDCEQVFIQQRTACINAANSTLTSCQVSCQL